MPCLSRERIFNHGETGSKKETLPKLQRQRVLENLDGTFWRPVFIEYRGQYPGHAEKGRGRMETQILRYMIVRRNSPYNKNIKWFVDTYLEDGTLISSCGYRTERLARESVVPNEYPFPIGDKLVHIELQEITGKETLQ
jgi:hypothetical protein